MIRVVRIAGESYDLETGATCSKEVILSNGHREIGLPVDDERVQHLLLMAAEVDMLTQLRTADPEPKPAPKGNGGVEHVKVTVALSDDIGVVDEVEAHSQVYEPEPDEEYEPGEEYNDPTTGVGSL